MTDNVDAICIFDPKSSYNPTHISGSIHFHQCPEHRQCLVTFELKGFKPFAQHAIHIHENGITKLEGACESTCSHYNPTRKLHGSIRLYGNDRHAGDLINNLIADKEGEFNFQYEDDMINVDDIFGRTVVIHSGVDDLGRYRNVDMGSERQKGSATTGNAGGRIACSVIGRGKPCA